MPKEKRRLRRTPDAYVAGVIGGLAEFFDLDPTMCRVVYVLLSIVSVAFPGIIVYLILWMIIPEREESYWY